MSAEPTARAFALQRARLYVGRARENLSSVQVGIGPSLKNSYYALMAIDFLLSAESWRDYARTVSE